MVAAVILDGLKANLAVGALLAVGVLLALQTWRLHTEQLAHARAVAEIATERTASETAARAAEKVNNTKYQEALNAARTREVLLRTEIDSLRRASDELREQNTYAARQLASAPPAAILEYAAAVGAVFDDCRAKYASVAAAADGHASDVRTLIDAWPVNPRRPDGGTTEGNP